MDGETGYAMVISNDIARLPGFLQSLEALAAHFDEHFVDVSSPGRGNRFVTFVERLLPLTETGRQFSNIARNAKETYDEGVDIFTAENEDGERLLVQSKYKIRTKDELDTIISKFHAFDESVRAAPGQQQFDLMAPSVPVPIYMVVTSSKLQTIMRRYEKSELASTRFYEQLLEERRLEILDGPGVLERLQAIYTKSYLLPEELVLFSSHGWLVHGGVWIGTVEAADLLRMYDDYGDALFFENIRDFLGVSTGKRQKEDREQVNSGIIETIRMTPERMLERNNGLTFRGASVQMIDDRTIRVSKGAIVNGCQTTMCIVYCRAELRAGCLIPAKVVQTADAWEIARAANYQNPVRKIDLDLARYLRPQLVQKAASDQGYAVDTESSENIGRVLEGIHRRTIDYEEMKALYLGLFSRSPSNLFEDNYRDLRTDVLEILYSGDEEENERVFETLFLVLTAARMALNECQSTYSGHNYSTAFKRFQERPKYRAYLAVLALCGALEQNLADRASTPADEGSRMVNVLRSARGLVENDPESYVEAYLLAYQTLAEVALQVMSGTVAEAQVLQEMHKRVSGAGFDALYRSLRLKLDAGQRLAMRRQKT